ncbi:MAG: nucleotidyltransferase [Ectothiorhodospiraceae bacterium AqS1]|nr:nucleotidyltransferase [Ectothiorhodospiraceae bacterium AqS1]
MNLSKQHLIDELLTYCGMALDLTPTQYKNATQKYQAVGDWLNKPGTLLAEAQPLIYPQGSMAIGTATKPVNRSEFDLDLVCQIQINDEASPADLKRAVGQRLKENDIYLERLEEKNRCWRIVYADEFHMDILPGRHYPRAISGTALLVSDKNLATWKETDPKGYANWFAERCHHQITLVKGVRDEVEAPPPSPQTSTKMPLQLAVQILKRHRDLRFGDDKDAPISIIITTLAAKAYEGQNSVFETLLRLIARMPSFIEKDSSGESMVINPVNPQENFADKWREAPRKENLFFDWLHAAKRDLIRLSNTSLPNAVNDLTPFVGERISSEAVRQYAKNLNDQRKTTLRCLTATGVLGAESANARPIPPNTFFGRDS